MTYRVLNAAMAHTLARSDSGEELDGGCLAASDRTTSEVPYRSCIDNQTDDVGRCWRISGTRLRCSSLSL